MIGCFQCTKVSVHSTTGIPKIVVSVILIIRLFRLFGVLINRTDNIYLQIFFVDLFRVLEIIFIKSWSIYSWIVYDYLI